MREIKTARELVDPLLEERWARRRSGPDADDLLHLVDGRVRMAYPWSAAPTAFVVEPEDVGERYACCAIDALGIAAMLGRGVHVRSRCHQSGAPLAFSVSPDGPGPEARDMMVWVGRCATGERRISAGL